jgi:hypothetical protein
MGRFCLIATRAKSEILRLVPSNLRHNTSKRILEVLRSGDKVETCLRLVSAFSGLSHKGSYEVETKRIHVSTIICPITMR